MKEKTLAIPGNSNGFFRDFGTAAARGDLFVKLSLLWWGAGYILWKQYVKAVIMTLLAAAG